MRNASKNTRRATAITLTAALAIAVYLNWQYANSDLTVDTETLTAAVAAANAEVDTSDESLAVSSTVTDALLTESEALESANKNYGEAQLVSVSSSTGSEFFEEARLNRQKAYDEALETIQKSLKGSSLSSEEKSVYTAQLTASLENITAENEIETLIKAKGFADCLCFLQDGQANLTVMTSGEGLDAAQVAQIRDIVLSKCDVTAQNITVTEVK